jgi:cobalt-zinc-cadmium efflux system protein
MGQRSARGAVCSTGPARVDREAGRGFRSLAFLVMRDWSQRRRLGCVLALNVLMIAGLIITGLIAHSLGVLAAAGDFAADSVGLVLGLVAVGLRDRRRITNGRHSRATTAVALINGAALLAVTVLVLVEAVQRLRHGTPEVHGLPVLVVSAISTLVMLVGAAILGFSAGSEDLHMRSVLLDTLSDGAAAAAVAVTGGVIAITHKFYWLDPALAAAIAVVVGIAAVKLLADGIPEMRRGFAAPPGNENH